jgi:hypothetical protein
MTNEQLTELEELCEKATPGPWRISRNARIFEFKLKADGRFIAAARTALPELIAEVRRLRNERLHWTTDLPSAPGWYFFRLKPGGKFTFKRVYKAGGCLFIDQFPNPEVSGVSIFLGNDGEWAGPIPEPANPIENSYEGGVNMTIITEEERAQWRERHTSEPAFYGHRIIKLLDALKEAEADRDALDEDLKTTKRYLKEYEEFHSDLFLEIKKRYPTRYESLTEDREETEASASDLFEFVFDELGRDPDEELEEKLKDAEARAKQMKRERDALLNALADGGGDCPYFAFWADEEEPNLPDWCICSYTEEGGFDCEEDYGECWERWAKEQAAAFAIK